MPEIHWYVIEKHIKRLSDSGILECFIMEDLLTLPGKVKNRDFNQDYEK